MFIFLSISRHDVKGGLGGIYLLPGIWAGRILRNEMLSPIMNFSLSLWGWLKNIPPIDLFPF